jgi:citrate synthase
MGTLRISTFNCENLLSRPTILNFDDNERARKPLEDVVRLERILEKSRYSEADKRRIPSSSTATTIAASTSASLAACPSAASGPTFSTRTALRA